VARQVSLAVNWILIKLNRQAQGVHPCRPRT
jgi:hypothetical protein